MIFGAGLVTGILVASVASFLLLSLCMSAKERDEREARTYPPSPLEVSASEGFTLTDCTVNGAPLPPSWASGDDAA